MIRHILTTWIHRSQTFKVLQEKRVSTRNDPGELAPAGERD
jgi:hypothetical protein